eukprot:3252700-Prymnesium_polylepis.1
MVVSGKRRSYAEYERSQFSDQIATLQATVAALQAAVTTLQSKAVKELHGSGTTNPSRLFW